MYCIASKNSKHALETYTISRKVSCTSQFIPLHLKKPNYHTTNCGFSLYGEKKFSLHPCVQSIAIASTTDIKGISLQLLQIRMYFK